MIDYLHSIVTGQRRGMIASFLKFILWLLSFVYQGLVAVIQAGYDRHLFPRRKLPRPVISIGNITLGGVGKTPLVMMVAGYLRREQHRPAILIRGYMAKHSGQAGARSDEAQMIHEVLSDVAIGVGRDRWQKAHEILSRQETDIFVLDDGFQQWGLSRDLDIVVVDATRPFGNGYLLPRGFLREPKEALGRADIFVLTKNNNRNGQGHELVDELVRLNPQALIVEGVHQPVNFSRVIDGEIAALGVVEKRPVAIVCSIGDPKNFFLTIDRLGAMIVKQFIFPDHHVYQAKDVETIAKECREAKISCVLTTAKDAVKLKGFLPILGTEVEALSLNIRLEIVKGQDEFFHRMDSLLRR